MSVIDIHNWEDGSFGVESTIVRIYASCCRTTGAITSTTIAVHPAYLHRVGRPETEDAYGIETIRAALAARVAADFPDGAHPVTTSATVEYLIEGLGPRREDGNRLGTDAWERLRVPCTKEEVDAARARLIQSVREKLADISQYWDDQGPEAWAARMAQDAAELKAGRSRADA